MPLAAFSQYEYEIGVEARGYLNNGQNPFWFYSNQMGMVSEQTTALGLLDGHYKRLLGEYFDIEVGGSLFFDYADKADNQIRGNEYYATLGWNVIRFTAGARARPERMLGISSVNGDVLWSNNARAIPGVELYMAAPFWITRWLGIEAGISHFWLNDERFVQDPYIHYKYGSLNFQLSERSLLKFGLQHYAQWGGVSPESGPQPSSFSDFIRVFFGASGDTSATEPDQVNVLGNQLGSWRLNYQYTLEDSELSFYFQNLFENTSGLELNNFPDGVWGAFWQFPENSPVRGILYEYSQTTWLRSSGNGNGENYFNNGGTYRSGWTYFDRVIGTPFIEPDPDRPGVRNNRFVAHHLGLRAALSKLDIKFLGSYISYIGSGNQTNDPAENIIRTQILFQYPFGEYATLGFHLGGDFSDLNNEIFGAGLSFSYAIGESYRMY